MRDPLVYHTPRPSFQNLRGSREADPNTTARSMNVCDGYLRGTLAANVSEVSGVTMKTHNLRHHFSPWAPSVHLRRPPGISPWWLGVIPTPATRGLVEGSGSGLQCLNCPQGKNRVRTSLSRARKERPGRLLDPHWDAENSAWTANVHARTHVPSRRVKSATCSRS